MNFVRKGFFMKQLQLNNKVITLVLTAHVSKQSVIDVQETIDQIQPDCICIELDDKRLDSINHPKDLTSMKLIDVIKEKKVAMVVVNYILANYQKKMAEHMDSGVGDEMREGMKQASTLNVPLHTIDRDIQTTFNRIWHSLSFFEKTNLIVSFIAMMFDDQELNEEELLKMKQEDILNEALKEISEQFPTVARILVTERDQYMAQKIKDAPGSNVVAIIGAAHANGIIHHLQQPDIQTTELEVIPKSSLLSKIIKYLLPVLLLSLIFFTSGINKVGSWLLIAAGASALGAILMLAHPITILVSFLTAPISTLSPVLSVGWFAGLSEAHFRAPTVGDFNSLNDDARSIKKALKNNILRTLLIMIVTSLLSALVTIFFTVDAIKNFFF